MICSGWAGRARSAIKRRAALHLTRAAQRANRHTVGNVERGLRLLIYDRTCRGRHGLPGLSHAWGMGRHLYRGLGRIDAAFGAGSWGEALAWLIEVQAPGPIAEVQFWGHGHFGQALVAGEALDARALTPGHRHHEALARVRDRMLPGEAGLWWFRTCETFGGGQGHAFARAWADFFGCRAAGHTHVIGIWQSGLHSLLPGSAPSWSRDEGVALTDTGSTRAAGLPSHPGAPNTVSFLTGRIPVGY
jgi:hypothetical protein